MKRTVIGLAALLATLPTAQVAAQAATPDSIPPAGWPQELEQDRRGGPGVVSRIATGVGGALLGAGLGFFASHIVQGDWDDTNVGQPIDRSLWAVVGGSLGFAVGMRFPVLGGRGALGRPGLPMGRDHLGADELQGLGIDNVYDAVATLRPEWLRIRGNRSLAASVDPVRVEGTGAGLQISGSTTLISEAATIQVYVDGVNTGGLETLNNIIMLTVRDMYFLDAAAATIRWGEGNPHGAILVIT
jgi:hypothetical protein